jgi:long-chain acyl-CoA synthetase
MSIASHIRKACQAGGDATAIDFDGATLTWNALSDATSEIRSAIEAAKLNDRVIIGLLGRNRLGPVAAFISLLGAGRSILLINVSRAPALVAEEIADLKLACVVGAPEDIGPEIKSATAKSMTMLIAANPVSGRVAFNIVQSADAGAFREVSPDVLIEIQTSGTTGKPKRIPISERTFTASLKDGVRTSKGAVEQKELKPKSSPTLMFGPLVHTSGAFNTLMSVFEVRPIILFEKFDPEKYRDALVKYRPKFAPLPPTAIKMLVDSSTTREDFSSVIAVRAGTSPLSVGLQTEFEEKFGVPVLTTYGATEFMGVATSWTLDDYQEFGKTKRGSVGRASKGVQIRVVDPASFEPLPAGEQGILEAKLDRLDGGKDWIRTTDLASIDGDGFLFIHGRVDDAIIRGGFKVMAGKVADEVKKYEGVFDAMVLGWPDERLGEIPIAVVEPYENRPEIDEIDLKKFLKTKLSTYEVPALYYIVDKLPRTVSEKISRPETINLVKFLRDE